MLNHEKNNLSVLFSEEVHGPFVTFLLNTHVAHQKVEKDSLSFKNFAKFAKERFEKKYPKHSWAPFQQKIDALLADASFWRNASASFTIILTPTEHFIYRLNVPVEEQYYVDDRPYFLGIIKNRQFSYAYYLLALNRDSMKIYKIVDQTATEVNLPKDAPTDLIKALGDELTGGNLNYSVQGGGGKNGSKEGVAFHGVNTKDEEVEIDWQNYYQAIDTFLKNEFENPEKLPVYLFALPENQTLFKKIAKNPYLNGEIAYSASPAQASAKEVAVAVESIQKQLQQVEIANYNALLDRKFIDQLKEIVPAADEGRISHFFISTSNLINKTNVMSSEEFDRRKLLNTITDKIIKTGGDVFVLDQSAAPDEKTLTAILRY